MAPALATAPVGALLPLMSTGFDRPLPEAPTLYTADGELDAIQLPSVIFDIRRSRPLLVATRCGHRPPADLTDLAATLWPTADVVDVRTHETAQAFCAHVPSWLGAYGGQVRLYLPGTDIADERNQHPFITREPQGSYEKKIASFVTTRARQHRRSDPALKLSDAIAAHNRTKTDLARAREDIARLKECAVEPDDDDPVYSDPVVQFEHELELAWLRTTPEHDRDEWGLRSYTLGSEFLGSLDAIEVPRARVLRACVDVVTGRYPHIDGRNAKRFKDTTANSGGGKPVLVRASDGATAWRCSIQMSGIAARLMWWERRNGHPELSRVADHNDYRIT